jgi:anaphase-promoting complex subunit 8
MFLFCWAVLCLQEYQRAAHVLTGLETPVAVFLRCYALYLAGEKRKE